MFCWKGRGWKKAAATFLCRAIKPFPGSQADPGRDTFQSNISWRALTTHQGSLEREALDGREINRKKRKPRNSALNDKQPPGVPALSQGSPARDRGRKGRAEAVLKEPHGSQAQLIQYPHWG